MKTTTATQKIQTILDASFATIDQSMMLYGNAVAKPVVELGSSWGRFTVEIQLNWEIKGVIVAAFKAAGIAYQLSNFGRIVFDVKELST